MNQKKIHNINKPGFKVPKDYFDNLEDAILSDIELKASIDNSGFKTPEGFFNTLEKRIMEQISEKETTKVISLFTRKNLMYFSSVAAAIILLMNLSIFKKDSEWNKLDTDTVENYIIEENIGSYEIAALLSESDLKEENFINHNFNEENLETYLLENLDAEDLIIE